MSQQATAAPHVVSSGFDGENVQRIFVDSNGILAISNYVWNASSLAWEKATGSLAGGSSVEVNNFPATYPVTGTFFQATQPVSAASLPLPSNAASETGGNLATIAGKDFATQTTLSALNAKVTAVNTGAVVVSSGSLTANAGTNLNTSALALESSLSSLNAKVTAVNTGAVVISSGAVNATDVGSGKTLKSAAFSLTSTGTAVALVSGKRIKVYAVKLVVTAALLVNWRSGASTALEGAQSLAINGGYTESVDPPTFLFGTAAGESLDLVITGVGTAAGRISYWDDDSA